jgi:hypothetical protein
MPEDQDDLQELATLRVFAVRSVQDKSETVEDMLSKADDVVDYYLYGRSDNSDDRITETSDSQPL